MTRFVRFVRFSKSVARLARVCPLSGVVAPIGLPSIRQISTFWWKRPLVLGYAGFICFIDLLVNHRLVPIKRAFREKAANWNAPLRTSAKTQRGLNFRRRKRAQQHVAGIFEGMIAYACGLLSSSNCWLDSPSTQLARHRALPITFCFPRRLNWPSVAYQGGS